MVNKSGWAGVLIALLVLLGSGTAAYSNVKSDIAVLNNKVEGVQEKDRELDSYDAHLSGDVGTLKDRLTRTEAEQQSIRRTQDEIKYALNELLKEIRQMNENMIRMGSKKGVN
jgi:septal ring factor EnvC (AmiA/AmiB activator)